VVVYNPPSPQMNLSSTLPGPQRRSIRWRLLRWYDKNQRKLPWRGDRDPYRVWVSEIMLQQTRVNAVKDHYRRFVDRFPTVEALALAKPAAVLAAWSGLGYYRRARSLHEAARLLLRAGDFPTSSAAWSQLPGIGRYTAAAIASIAFGERCAVVDGNVERVLGRMFGLSPKRCWDAAEQLLSRTRPGDFNQALMELGATVCLPRAPLCETCPVAGFCRGREAVKTAAKPRNMLEVAYELLRRGAAVRLVRRPRTSSLMPGMLELPSIPLDRDRPCLLQLRHSITVTDYRVSVYAGAKPSGIPSGTWVQVSHLPELPLTGLTRKILRRLSII